jgi:hypothetical protein
MMAEVPDIERRTGLTQAERKLRAQVAAHSRWARSGVDDGAAQARRAQAGLVAKFEREVDPEGKLPPAERTRRAEHARRAHMAKLSLASAKARRRSAR